MSCQVFLSLHHLQVSVSVIKPLSWQSDLKQYHYRLQDLQLCILAPTKDTGVNAAWYGASSHIHSLEKILDSLHTSQDVLSLRPQTNTTCVTRYLPWFISGLQQIRWGPSWWTTLSCSEKNQHGSNKMSRTCRSGTGLAEWNTLHNQKVVGSNPLVPVCCILGQDALFPVASLHLGVIIRSCYRGNHDLRLCSHYTMWVCTWVVMWCRSNLISCSHYHANLHRKWVMT